MKKSVLVFFLAVALTLMSGSYANGSEPDNSATVAIYSGSSGCIFWKNVTDVEVNGSVVKFRKSDGEKITLVNCATVIYE